ncbi:MAG: tyrosine-type recombinase/integrase [Phycisphaeraceae bacterium]|nr:tyrosine-type recombinase/integrase [Phycisphaeraceae bacterium]
MSAQHRRGFGCKPGRAERAAINRVGFTKPASCHTFGHSFVTHLLKNGYDIRALQELLIHHDAKMTMIYTSVVNRSPSAVRSPAAS